MRHPIQPLYTDEHGVIRFKANAIVRFLLDKGGYNLNARLDAFRLREREKDEALRREVKGDAMPSDTCRDTLLNLRPATPEEYSFWLRGYMLAGNEPTHSYDYPMPAGFYVAIGDIALPPLYGARSISIIVPSGIAVTFGPLGIGHSNLYFLDGYTCAAGRVPVYSDTLIAPQRIVIS